MVSIKVDSRVIIISNEFAYSAQLLWIVTNPKSEEQKTGKGNRHSCFVVTVPPSASLGKTSFQVYLCCFQLCLALTTVNSNSH